jgi:hypothetical protein
VEDLVVEDVLLIQVHIPRSGGTSIASWLRLAATSGLTAGHADLYPAYNFTSESQLRFAGLGDPRVVTASTHNIRNYPETLCGRPARYFTILREPLDQFASLVRYIASNRERFQVPGRLTTLRDIAAWYIDARLGEVASENIQTNHLALFPWCEMTKGRCDPESYARWTSADLDAYWSARLEVAKLVLSTFAVVGIFDRLRESVDLIHRRGAGFGITLASPDELPFVNETPRSEGDVAWLDHATPLGRAIRESLSDDMRLYEHAVGLFRSAMGETSQTRSARA